jgi:hypothetical protein
MLRAEMMLLALEAQLGSKLLFGLTGSTEWDSRIIWPPELVGRPCFAFRELKPATWKEKLSHRFFGPTYEYFLTKEAQAFLKKKQVSPQSISR